MKVRQLTRKLFDVSSDSEPNLKYRVNVEDSECECMAWEMGKTRPCKHIIRVRMWLGGKGRKSQLLEVDVKECPNCGDALSDITESVGFEEHSKIEVVGRRCINCGFTEKK